MCLARIKFLTRASRFRDLKPGMPQNSVLHTFVHLSSGHVFRNITIHTYLNLESYSTECVHLSLWKPLISWKIWYLFLIKTELLDIQCIPRHEKCKFREDLWFPIVSCWYITYTILNFFHHPWTELRYRALWVIIINTKSKIIFTPERLHKLSFEMRMVTMKWLLIHL